MFAFFAIILLLVIVVLQFAILARTQPGAADRMADTTQAQLNTILDALERIEGREAVNAPRKSAMR